MNCFLFTTIIFAPRLNREQLNTLSHGCNSYGRSIVGWFDQTFEAAFSSFTLKQQVEHLGENLQKLEERVARLEGKFEVLAERMARIDNFREADRAQLRAEIAGFKLEVERAALRLNQLPPAN